jgi:hypothetical protein
MCSFFSKNTEKHGGPIELEDGGRAGILCGLEPLGILGQNQPEKRRVTNA